MSYETVNACFGLLLGVAAIIGAVSLAVWLFP
jgi:hypothetical protein